MAQDYAKAFYKSRAWIKCRDGFLKSRHYICERCGGLAVIVHHKNPITPENIDDPYVTLNWDNLMALCHECHNCIHGSQITADGLTFDVNGNLIQIDSPRSSAAG
ncbi:HNH endonuclease [Thermicanus aegyptius]|uniref:HNH endonuclease n=1 Tax=Thermicanus aegyptius TaxID=94009 RepID=UPI0004291071|nr:HNH endonuclease [Thermicanus aegyptius]